MRKSIVLGYLLQKTDISAFSLLFRDGLTIILLVSVSMYMNNFKVYILSVGIIVLFQSSLGEALLHEDSHNPLFKISRLK